MKQILISKNLIEETLEFLKVAGKQQSEGVVLWLAAKNQVEAIISEAYIPEQESSWGNFRIPRRAVVQLMRHLRAEGLYIAAQVHSHPSEAFHSSIDDEWAIVRHEGALSLVLPDFALNTSPDSFANHTAVFRLSAGNTWDEVSREQIPYHYQITHE
jgi:hypothetical protein